jgi:ABC-2 type transport system permease protein
MSAGAVSTESKESTDLRDAVAVRVPGRGIRHELRAAKIVWQREIMRFWGDRARMLASMSQPVLWLLVMGTGLSNLVARGGGDIDLKTFIYPGVCAMSVMFASMQSAGSIVWDREFGFLREMLIAPVSSGAIVLGKCLGGAFVATIQGMVIALLAPLVGVPYDPVLMLTLLGEMFLGGLALTGFGVMMAVRFKGLQGFYALMQVVILPMMFLSGAFFPLSGLPIWLNVFTRFNPLTYVVDPLRQAVFARLDGGPALAAAFNHGVTWYGWRVPVPLELTIVVVLGVCLLGLATLRFRDSE